jgi:hypothetical protein
MQTDQDQQWNQQRHQDRVVFNMFDRSWQPDPYPLFRQLRAEAPAGRIPGVDGRWYLARYASCEAVRRAVTAARCACCGDGPATPSGAGPTRSRRRP